MKSKMVDISLLGWGGALWLKSLYIAYIVQPSGIPFDPGIKFLLVFMSVNLRCSFIWPVCRQYCKTLLPSALKYSSHNIGLFYCCFALSMETLHCFPYPRLNTHQNKVPPPRNSGEVCWQHLLSADLLRSMCNCFGSKKNMFYRL